MPLATEDDPVPQQRVAKVVTAAVYNSLSRWLDKSDSQFMNYGYQPADASEESSNGNAAPAREQFSMNLYRKVAGAADLAGKDVLEVGSGRGGGAAFVAREFHPRSMTGVDLTPKAVAHAQSAHHEPNLQFVKGDAENLPFGAGSFDAVVNVESSHGYPSMHRFLAEVHRVLRPDGLLLFADVRSPEDTDVLRDQFGDAALTIVEEERITPGVARALELDRARRGEIVASIPKVFRPVAATFIGAQGGEIYAQLQSGQTEYTRFLLRRGSQAGPSAS
jgi:SAM-dependent methyltransferase